MSTIGIGGPGIPLPYPSNNYGYSPVGGTNVVAITAGTSWTIPAGTWLITPGPYSVIQYIDPVLGATHPFGSLGNMQPIPVNSDGTNYQVSNLSGTIVGVLIDAAGAGYSTAPTITASAWTGAGGIGALPTFTTYIGGAVDNPSPVLSISGLTLTGTTATVTFATSRFVPPVGSAVTIAGTTGGTGTVNGVFTVTAATTTTATYTCSATGSPSFGSATVQICNFTSGLNYKLPPIVTFSAPPTGVAATGYATIGGTGQVTSVTMLDSGAGYITAPTMTFTTDPSDPNYNSSTVAITQAKGGTLTIVGSAGQLTGVVVTNNGSAITTDTAANIVANNTLTLGAGGTTAAAIRPLFLVGAAAPTGSAGSGSTGSFKWVVDPASPVATATTVATYLNPTLNSATITQRPATFAAITVSSAGVSAPVVVDPGLYLVAGNPASGTNSGAPNAYFLASSGATAGTLPTLTQKFGGVVDRFLIQAVV